MPSVDKNISLTELRSSILNLKKELMNARFQKALGELKNSNKVKKIKKEIARVYTILNESKKHA